MAGDTPDVQSDYLAAEAGRQPQGKSKTPRWPPAIRHLRRARGALRDAVPPLLFAQSASEACKAWGGISPRIVGVLSMLLVALASGCGASHPRGAGGAAELPTATAAAGLRRSAVDGEPVARVLMPTIGVDLPVVAGWDPGALDRGPGLFPQRSYPGQPGTVAIAGHRTSHGAPFRRIDRLRPGDGRAAGRRAAHRIDRVRRLARRIPSLGRLSQRWLTFPRRCRRRETSREYRGPDPRSRALPARQTETPQPKTLHGEGAPGHTVLAQTAVGHFDQPRRHGNGEGAANSGREQFAAHGANLGHGAADE